MAETLEDTVDWCTLGCTEEKKKNYQILKKTLLNACGLSLSDCAFQFFSQTKKSSWTWAEAGC